MQSDNEKTADVAEDYTWKVAVSGNPNKAWVVYQNKKISALMTTRTARDIATIHNMTLKFLGTKAALAAMPKVSEWQLIESAPRDGRPFVGTDGHYSYRTYLGKYYVKWPHEEGGPTYEEKWNKETNSSITPWNPTHWMPLPLPPTTAKE